MTNSTKAVLWAAALGVVGLATVLAFPSGTSEGPGDGTAAMTPERAYALTKIRSKRRRTGRSPR